MAKEASAADRITPYSTVWDRSGRGTRHDGTQTASNATRSDPRRLKDYYAIA